MKFQKDVLKVSMEKERFVVIKTGIDMVAVDRMKSLYEKKTFSQHFLADSERDYIVAKSGVDENGKKIVPYQTIAGLFASKEAVSKAFGIGFSKGLRFSEIEIFHTGSGEPNVKLSGYFKEVGDTLGVKSIAVSISHDGGFAIAVCVIEI